MVYFMIASTNVVYRYVRCYSLVETLHQARAHDSMVNTTNKAFSNYVFLAVQSCQQI